MSGWNEVFKIGTTSRRTVARPASDASLLSRRGSAICELLLLALTEGAILSVDEARGVLEDAAAANRNAIPLGADGEQHKAAAERIELILAGRNSVRIE